MLGLAGLSVLGRSLSLCGKHPNVTIIQTARTWRKDSVRKSLTTFAVVTERLRSPHAESRNHSLCGLSVRTTIDWIKIPYFLGPTILGPRKMAFVSSLLGMYLANYLLSVTEGTLCGAVRATEYSLASVTGSLAPRAKLS